MEKDKKILLSLVMIVLVLAGVFGGFAWYGFHDSENNLSDAEKFKREYESYNGKINESNQMSYPNVSVSSENPIQYLSDDEAASLLKDQTGLFYFGYPSCPWCRTMVPILLAAAKSTNLGKIYYVDIQNIRDKISLDEKDELVVEDEGTNGYRNILNVLDSVLEPFYLTGKDGKKIDTLEKRLYAPTVVSVKDGKILSIHVDTVASQKSGYSPLSKEEEEELFAIYQKMILELLSSTCDESC